MSNTYYEKRSTWERVLTVTGTHLESQGRYHDRPFEISHSLSEISLPPHRRWVDNPVFQLLGYLAFFAFLATGVAVLVQPTSHPYLLIAAGAIAFCGLLFACVMTERKKEQVLFVTEAGQQALAMESPPGGGGEFQKFVEQLIVRISECSGGAEGSPQEAGSPSAEMRTVVADDEDANPYRAPKY